MDMVRRVKVTMVKMVTMMMRRRGRAMVMGSTLMRMVTRFTSFKMLCKK